MKGKKIHARQLTLKNIHALDNEEKFLRLENSPPPPITFLMVRP